MSWFFDDIINTVVNKLNHDEDLKTSKSQFFKSLAENQRQYNTSLEEHQRQYNTSLGFNAGQARLQQQNWEQNFAQQQYNYENASQIRANDMLKAGLNPLMLVGGAEGSTPVSLGPSVSAPGASGAPGATSVSGHGVSPFSSSISLGILDKYIDIKEREKDRKNQKEIAQINAQAQRDVADTHKSASDYSADVSNAIAHIVDNTRRDELDELKREYDWTLEKDIKMFAESLRSKEKMELIHEDREDSRKILDVTSSNYRAVLSAYESAIRTSTEFALSVNKLKLEWEKFQTEKDYKKRQLALENTKIALDSATSIFQSISNMTGDVCKGFIIGRLK